MNDRQKMERILSDLPQGVSAPRLLLHSCCAPCSSSVLETLAVYFDITVDYYNPNIDPPAEYRRRADEQLRFVEQMEYPHTVCVQEAVYDPQEFYTAVQGLEQIPEGGARCFACYALRLRHAAQAARAGNYDFFTTTLSVSPHKNAAKLNEIGYALEQELGVRYLPADFKKKEGFKRSMALAAEYGLYRQDYCGCAFSRKERNADSETS